jgi:hypothetical protein
VQVDDYSGIDEKQRPKAASMENYLSSLPGLLSSSLPYGSGSESLHLAISFLTLAQLLPSPDGIQHDAPHFGIPSAN